MSLYKNQEWNTEGTQKVVLAMPHLLGALGTAAKVLPQFLVAYRASAVFVGL